MTRDNNRPDFQRLLNIMNELRTMKWARHPNGDYTSRPVPMPPPTGRLAPGELSTTAWGVVRRRDGRWGAIIIGEQGQRTTLGSHRLLKGAQTLCNVALAVLQEGADGLTAFGDLPPDLPPEEIPGAFERTARLAR